MIVTKSGNLGCIHKWVFYGQANTQVCVICGRCETPNPQTALVFVPLWENPKVFIRFQKSLDMSKFPSVLKYLGNFCVAINYGCSENCIRGY